MEDQASNAVLARRVVGKMLEQDAFSRWLGIAVVELEPGHVMLKMVVREEMTNGFGIAHGGIIFALADSAFAFATNTAGSVCVAVSCEVSYPSAVQGGDELSATAVQESVSKRMAFGSVTVKNQRNEIVGLFRGVAYRTKRMHFPD